MQASSAKVRPPIGGLQKFKMRVYNYLMKKFALILASIVLLFFSSKSVLAATNNYRFNEVSEVKEGETIEGNFFGSGERVQISGHVTGDVYAAGGNIIIDGIVDGDLIAAGGNIIVSGNIGQDARIAGGQLTVDGEVLGNLTAAGGNVYVSNMASIGKGLVAFAGNLDINAPVGEGIEAFVGNLSLSSNAQVGTDVNYWSEETAKVSRDASVSGTLTKQTVPFKMKWEPQVAMNEFFDAVGTFALVTSFLTTLLLGFLVVKLFPKFMHSGVEILSSQTARSFGIGLLALIVTPILITVLFVTVIGIPLAVIMTLVVLVSFYLVRLYAMLGIGVMILKRFIPKYVNNDLLAFVIGMLAYYIISMIPVVGGIFVMLVFIASLGASVINKHKFYTSFANKELL